MPCNLFWALESCIPRVLAEMDMRRIGVGQALVSEKAMSQQKDHLIFQMGEIYVVEHAKLVAAEPGALEKLRALAGR